ncbi:MAG: VWA domain-containing protein, partial [Pseudobdellovibrio sp.]
VGLLLFSSEVELFVPPKKGKFHVYRILREILFFKPKNKKTHIESALSYLRGVLKKRATIFILSDFQDKGYETSLTYLEKKHEVIAGLVTDPAEFAFPDVGLIDLHDAETGETILVDTSNLAFREEIKSRFKNEFEKFKKNLKKSGVDSFSFETDDNYHKSLLAFFKRRKAAK